jgi:hypothetical protein
MPATPPLGTLKGEHLFRQFRPEFVSSPDRVTGSLSADAFSRFAGATRICALYVPLASLGAAPRRRDQRD